MDSKLALITLLALAGTALFFMDSSEVPMSEDMPEDTEREYIFQLYQSWKTKYGKNVNDDFEDAYRFSVFSENYYFVEQHNAESTGVDALKLELNAFASMTNEEFADTMFGDKFAESQQYVMEIDEEQELLEDIVGDWRDWFGLNVPEKVDWTQKGAVNTPMQQGLCGSCWTFSITAGLECLAFKETGQLQKFSEQGIVSCAKGNMMNGCSGGSTTIGYQWTAQNGVYSEQEYPYIDAGVKVASPCDHSKTNNVVFKNPGGVSRVYGTVSAMQKYASKQVLSVAINATSIYFQLYQGGTLSTAHCPTDLNHGVNIVGYDMTADTPYWKIKNSWGANWGMHGFFQLKVREGKGTCGVNQLVDAPNM